MVQKKFLRKNIYYTEEVISQFSAIKLKACHLVSFNVSIIICLTLFEMIFKLTPHSHRHNSGHCCNRLCYVMSQCSKMCSFLLIDDILHIIPVVESNGGCQVW
jgi:hypothetical protein